MAEQASVELTIRHGRFGEQVKTITLPISEYLLRELMCTVELSDDPFSLMLASPGLMGGRGDAVTIRRKAFTMRREAAKDIARLLVQELTNAFGVNDELDGYKVSEMSDEERAYHQQRGRLPRGETP